MRYILIIMSFCFSIFLLSCGGTIGRIESYDFPRYDSSTLRNKVKTLLNKNPSLCEFDTSKYEEGKSTLLNGYYYITVTDGGVKYILKYAYRKQDSLEVTPSISLLSGAKYGEGLLFAKNIGYFDKKLYKKLFEERFIDELTK